MSLLHKALKKAEKESEVTGTASVYVDAADEKPRSSKLPYIIAASVILSALIVFGYIRYLKKPAEVVPTEEEVHAAQQAAAKQEALGLAGEAVALIETGRLDEAKVKLDRSVGLDPGNPDAQNNLGYIMRRMGRSDEAIDRYQKAMALKPDCVECLNNLGVLFLSGQKLPEAEDHLRRAIQARGDYADPYFNLAILYEAQGKVEEAKAHFTKFMELAKGIEADFILKIQQRITDLGAP